MRQVVRNWIKTKALPKIGKRVIWDLGTGWGDFSKAFVDEGAAHVYASDVVLNQVQIGNLIHHPLITFIEGDIKAAIKQMNGKKFPDIVFMHLMTEHVYDLRSFLTELYEELKGHECSLFLHHDNYYHPVGHHDHEFLSLNSESFSIEPKAPPCWTVSNQGDCSISSDKREELLRDRSWQWSNLSETTVGDCTNCNFYLRSMPWAHLIHQERFKDVFPEKFYSESMNKLTPFQVKQYILDAGFTIKHEERTWIMNEVPNYLAESFSKSDLTTFTMTLLLAVE